MLCFFLFSREISFLKLATPLCRDLASSSLLASCGPLSDSWVSPFMCFELVSLRCTLGSLDSLWLRPLMAFLNTSPSMWDRAH